MQQKYMIAGHEKGQCRVMAWLPSAVVYAVILYATWLPAPMGDMELPPFPGFDKVIHAVFGGGLAGAMIFDYTRGRASLRMAPKAAVWYLAIVAMALMAIDEAVQGMLPIERTSDFADLLADWLGVAVGALTAPMATLWGLKRVRQRSR